MNELRTRNCCQTRLERWVPGIRGLEPRKCKEGEEKSVGSEKWRLELESGRVGMGINQGEAELISSA
ncbi:hypothetical protein TB2_013259 [Malus domestica]